MAGLGDGDKQPAEDFENFHKGEKPARIHTTHKHRRRRTCGRSGNRKKFQKEIHAKYDENETEEKGRDVSDVFHDLILGYLHQNGWGISHPDHTKQPTACEEFSFELFGPPLFLQTTFRILRRAGYELAPSYCSGPCHTTDCKPTRRSLCLWS